jgi:PST family polysaccharide transporter
LEPPGSDGHGGDSLGADADARRPLGNVAAKGFAWTFSRGLVIRGLSFLSFVVLAHLLSKSDYGVAALANVFFSLLALLTAVGLAQALVQRPTIDEVDLDSAFWLSTATGAALMVVLIVAAWPLASAVGQPELRPVLQAMSVCVLFAGVASTSLALVQRRLDFAVLAKNGMASNLVATAVGITFAFLGFGVWSLVVQTIIANAGASIGLIVVARFRPGRRASWRRARSLLSFSANVLGMQVSNFLNTRTDDFLIGTVRGATALGTYTVAYSALTVMTDVLMRPVQGVIFPVFSRLQHDVARLRQAYLTASRLAVFASAPVFLFVAAAAPELIPGLFGAKWEASVPVMQILCLYAPLFCLLQFNNALLLSIDRPKTVFRIAVAGTILQVAFFAAAVNFGLEAVAASYVLRAYIIAPVGLVIASRALGGTMRPMLADAVRVLIACAIMVLAVEAVRTAVGGTIPDLVVVVACATIALPAYLLTMRLIAADHLAQAVHYARAASSGRLPFGRLART